MSIDDATPEEWNKVNRKKDWEWMEEFSNDHPFFPVGRVSFGDKPDNKPDNEPNDHPVFGENIPDNSTKFDSVSKPEHYNSGGIECIDAIEGMLNHDEYIGYLRGNSLKYRWRYRYKGKPIEDLRKAEWYEERLMNYLLRHPSEQLR